MIKDIVIIGAGGFGREVAWLIECINQQKYEWNFIGYIDDDKEKYGVLLNDKPVIGDFSWLQEKSSLYYVCAIGNPFVKKKLCEKADRYSLKLATLIAPDVKISKHNEIGDGCIICTGNILTVNTKVEENVILNLDCTVGHDAIIRRYTTVLPNVNISGKVTIGECCNIGTGSAIIQEITIGDNVTLGAGSVVVRDLPDNCTAVGVPARVIKADRR